MAITQVQIEVLGIPEIVKALKLLTAVIEAGDQLIQTDRESAAYPALLDNYEFARAELMRFEWSLEHGK